MSLKKGRVLFPGQSETATGLQLHGAMHCTITFERKESGCLQDWREEEKEKGKGERETIMGGGRRGRENTVRTDSKWEGKQRTFRWTD